MQIPPISSWESVVGPSLTVRLRPANLSLRPSELVRIPSAERNISSVNFLISTVSSGVGERRPRNSCQHTIMNRFLSPQG